MNRFSTLKFHPLGIVLLLLLLISTASAEDWPAFRGPTGLGYSQSKNLRLHTPGVLKCWRAADGKLVYAERLDRRTSTWASPFADGNGRLYFATAGVSYVLQTGDRLFLVGTRQLYCVGAN